MQELAANTPVLPKQPSVCFVSPSFPESTDDWKSLFIKHILDALAASDTPSLSAWLPRGPLPRTVEYFATRAEEDWLAGLLERGGIASVLRQGSWRDRVTYPIGLLKRLRAAYRRLPSSTLIHANWLQTALPLGRLPNPLLVSVLGSDLALLRIPGIVATLRMVFRNRPTIIAPNAQWMVPILETAFSEVAEIRTIRFGVDDSWYEMVRKQSPDTCRRWITVARVTPSKIGALFEWFEPLGRKDHELHLFGPLQEQVAIPNWVRYHGPVTAKSLREQWFPAASGLISLSQHKEGLPQIFLEAMAAGLPVIASDIAPHREVVVNQENGYLVTSAVEFHSALEELSDPEVNRRPGERARAHIQSKFGTWSTCAARYIQAYETLLSSVNGFTR